MDEIFISYRRVSSQWEARCLYLSLSRQFPGGAIFYDLESIGGGDDWRERLDEALDSARVMLLVISPNWEQLFRVVPAEDPEGVEAPESGEASGPHDGRFLRTVDDLDVHAYEIERALARGMHVIPVLMGRDEPDKRYLPSNVARIVTRNWARVDVARFDDDVKRLENDVRRVLERGASPERAPRPPSEAAGELGSAASGPAPLAARLDAGPRPEPVDVAIAASTSPQALVQVGDAVAVVEAPTSALAIRDEAGGVVSSFGTTLRVEQIVVSGDGHAILVVDGGSCRVVALDGRGALSLGTSVLPWADGVVPVAAWRQGRTALQVVGRAGGALVHRRIYLNRAAQPAEVEAPARAPEVPGDDGARLVAAPEGTAALVADRELVVLPDGRLEGWPTIASRVAARRTVGVAGASSLGRSVVAAVASSPAGALLVGEVGAPGRAVDFELPLPAVPDAVAVPPVAGGVGAPRFVAVQAGGEWHVWDVEGLLS